jgi:predicted  nucleic acid-binding Zn-ribbon protein
MQRDAQRTDETRNPVWRRCLRCELDLTADLNTIGVPMMIEERTQFQAVLESIETQVKLIADAQVGLSQRLDRMETRFEARFDQLETQITVLGVKVDALATRVDALETRVGGLETRVGGLETKVGGLEVLAIDGQRRLQRIEDQLNGARSLPRAKLGGPPGRGKKS